MAKCQDVLSTAGSSQQEILHDKTLEAWNLSRTEPLEESNRRRSALTKLSEICKQWIKSVMITEFRLPPDLANEVGGRVFTTGSYRFNAHTSGSDIDVVLIAPEKITRRHFFGTLVDRLMKEPWVTEMVPTPDAVVPIIAMKCEGVDIDLSFGSIRRNTIPDNIDVLDDNLLRGLDETSVRAVNAVRVAQMLIDAVPQKGTFRQVLRFVKVWGKARGLYSSKFGYPTGIGWAILVAKVCQCYPNLNAAALMVRFFKLYTSWFKPEPTNTDPNRAVYLYSLTPKQIIPGVAKVWDPKNNIKDAQAVFPILTPAYPSMNACYNVTRTTLRVMCAEFKRGHEMLTSMIDKPVPLDQQYGIWSELIQPFPLFTSFTHYLYVRISTTTAESYQRWTDAAEAKIRFLWADSPQGQKGVALENYPQVRVHVFSSRYEEPSLKGYLETYHQWEKANKLGPLQAGKLGSAPTVAPSAVPGDPSPRRSTSRLAPEGAPELFTAHYFFGLELLKEQTGQKKINLSAMVQNFKELCLKIKEYKQGVTKLPEVEVIDKSKLPAWVVPTAPTPETATETTSGVTRKRERADEEAAAMAPPGVNGDSQTPGRPPVPVAVGDQTNGGASPQVIPPPSAVVVAGQKPPQEVPPPEAPTAATSNPDALLAGKY